MIALLELNAEPMRASFFDWPVCASNGNNVVLPDLF
jgi:hypothetical protein